MKFVCGLFVLCILYTLPLRSNGSPAKYSGTHAGHAGQVMNKSQGKKGFGFNNPGHPRNHASAGFGPSVEKYSQNSGQQKSGFDSRHIQNQVGHVALSHPKSQTAMNALNGGSKREVVHLTQRDLQMQHLTGGKWNGGTKTHSFPIGGATMVLQHHKGKEGDPNAPVHVQTFFPH